MQTDPKHAPRADRGEAALRDTLRFELAPLLLELARGTGADWGAWIEQMCQLDAEVLHAERVSFWSFDDTGSELTCDAGFVAGTREFEHGARLSASELPEYFEALREARTLNVRDAVADPRTHGLGDYCAARGISSKLDVPVWAEGKLRGILCHEHVGERGRWHPEEEEFAVGVGQVVASAIASRARTVAEAVAQRASFLDTVSRTVHSSLDTHEIARLTVALVVPKLGDCALLWMLDPDGALQTVAWTHADPRKQHTVDEVVHQLAQEPKQPNFASRVVSQRQSLLGVELTRTVLETYDFAPAERAAIERLGVVGAIGVPLAVTRATLGALVLLSTGRRFDRKDRELAEEVAQRVATALENARIHGTARDAIRARDDFLALVAHELRTPLTALQLATDDQLRKAQRCGDADAARRGEEIARHVRRFVGVVEHVLAASRIRAEGVKLALESCDLVALVERCVAGVSERAQRAGSPITIHAERPIVGEFDPACVERVVFGLLDNAIKFGEGKPIDLSVRRDGAQVEVAVRDRGPGIAKDRLSYIFLPFERAVPKERFGGLGLGLYVAKAIVEAHGGSIGAQSRAGEGTTFFVRLPLT
ncbi:MAG TPA: GAF domain-containing protein [Polyangiaceae bacterium]|nr:GAF domain-containing protein [Polyangiaceae bacterium]